MSVLSEIPKIVKQQTIRCYQCVADGCDVVAEKMSLCENATHCWKSTVRQENGTLRNARGCLTDPEIVRVICNSGMQMNDNQLRTECCTTDLCNNGTFPTLVPHINHRAIEPLDLTLSLLMYGLFGLACIVAIAAYYYYRRERRLSDEEYFGQQQMTKKKFHPMDPALSNVTVVATAPDLTITGIGDSSKDYHTNDSFTNPTKPKKRTLFQQISLAERLNEGSFNPALWRGIWLGVKNVTVKIYPLLSESTWTHETQIFKSLQPKHDNILQFVGSDVFVNKEGVTQMWLVTDFHSNGSLKNYLKSGPLDHYKMLKACLGLTNGLEYLHGTTAIKVSVAHCNLSSKNVFVNRNGECVIGGLEIAVTEEKVETDKFLEHEFKRYMSPEMLDPTKLERKMWSFRQSDIYSMGLIFWEICRRCISNNILLEYEAPFSDWLMIGDREPNAEEMCKLVVDRQRRPDILEHWQYDPIMDRMATVMQECWKSKAAERMPVVQVKEILKDLAYD